VPELPEVETVARQLEPELEGHAIERLEVLDPRWSRPVAPKKLGRQVEGRTIQGLGRRGKYLLLGLDGEKTLVMHLRMTGNLVLREDDGEILDPSEGRILYQGERTTEERHLRARFVLDDGREVWFTDPRRFGEAFLIDDAKLPERFSRLGVEPLSPEFTPQKLGEIAAGKKAPLKSFLLDQSGIAGVGNIYADEALYRARLHPLSPAGSMKPEHWAALRDGVVAAHETLRTAVETGDVETARSTLNTLSPLLTELSSERSLASESRELAAAAGQELTAATAELAARDLPPVTEMLSMLLQRLLILLAELVYNLLGGPLPLPVPVPIP